MRGNGSAIELDDPERAAYLLLAERRSLQMIAGGAHLSDILTEICSAIDEQDPALMSTVLLMAPDGKRLWPAGGPGVPPGWSQLITPLEIGRLSSQLRTATATAHHGDTENHEGCTETATSLQYFL